MTDEQMDARLRAAGQRWRERSDGETLTTELPDVDEEVIARPPHRRRTWFVAAAAAAVVALVAALTFALRGEPRHSQPNAERTGLQGVVWLLQGAHGSSSTATLYIGRDGTLVADDECRLIGGRTSVTGNRLTVSDLAVRYKPCTDQYGAGFYDRGTNVLRGPARYSIDAGGLTITRGRGSLRFVLAPKAVLPPSLDVPTLTDTTWRAPDGETLRIDAATGDVTGTYCTGHTMAGLRVHLGRCGLRGGSFSAAVSGSTLTLSSLPSHAPFPVKRRTLTFQWQPADPSIIDPVSLTGRTWTLDAVAGTPAPAGSLRIGNGVAHVDTGCNAFTVPATVKRGEFTLNHFAPPLRNACSIAATTAASILSDQPAAWVVRNGKLIVYGGGSQTFALVYGARQTSTSALQGRWTLAKVFGATGDVRPATAPATLTVAADGTVTGTDGCRSFHGTVSTSGTTATFALTMPEPACSPIIEQTASLVDKVLSGPVTFTIASSAALVLSKYEIGRLSFTGKPTSGPDPQLLTAHDWQITTIAYGSGHFRNGAPATDGGLLNFTTHGYEVQHSCSIVHGSAQLAPGTMLLGQQRSDGHSCPPLPDRELRAQSVRAIDTILAGNVTWSVNGSVLTLSGNRGTLVAIGGIRSDLTGSRWRLTATSRGNTSRAAVGSVVLAFPANDRLQVDRCYTSGAQVAVGDSSFTVFRLHTTVARPCPSGPPGTQQQNEIIDSVLTSEPLWSIVGNTLTLTGSGASLTFRR